MTTIKLLLPDEILAALKQSPERFEAELRRRSARPSSPGWTGPTS
jgi:hypothetical protein